MFENIFVLVCLVRIGFLKYQLL